MNAVEVEKKIREKFDSIADTIAFSYAKKDQKEVRERLSKLEFFVYDDTVLYTDKIAVVDRLEIAMDFAKDISLDLKVDEDRRFEIEYALGNLIIEAAKHDDSEKVIRDHLSEIREINDENYVSKILELVGFYKNDYEIKGIDKILAEKDNQTTILKSNINLTKYYILSSRFYVGGADIDKLWNLLDAFTDDLCLLQSGEYKDIVCKLQKEFYVMLGCEGETIEELSLDAMNRGIIMSSYVRGEIMAEFSEECDKNYGSFFYNTNNLGSIKYELDKKGFTYNKYDLRVGVTTPNVNAINFMCLDKDNNPVNIIIYCNSSVTYSTRFDTICFHEMIHYLGGMNDYLNKRGLLFNNMEMYRLLEESYVHYLSIQMAKEYNKNYGSILQPWFSMQDKSIYNVTLDYMKEVFKLYGKKLMTIHLSNDISLKEANALLPYDDIAYAIARIYYDQDPKKVTQEEIKKLIRSAKK